MRLLIVNSDVIWKFVPDHRTCISKGSLTKGVCFDRVYTKNAVVTGRTELSRWFKIGNTLDRYSGPESAKELSDQL